MDAFDLELHGRVAVATMSDGENRVGAVALDRWNELLDEVDSPDIGALVVAGTDAYWSTGLDLDEVGALDDAERQAFMDRVDRLLGRLLVAPVITVAGLNGHTYAAGALLALAFDYRIMRQDRGFFCLPSVDVGIPFSPGMSALIRAKLPQPIAHDLVVSCRRIGGLEAAATGAVNRAVDADAVVHVARETAHAYADKDHATLQTVKRRMYPEAVALLEGP